MRNRSVWAVKRTALLVAGLSLAVSPASASLILFETYVGAYDLSSDGCGSTTQACTLRVNAPVGGASVAGAFLYTSTFAPIGVPVGSTFLGGTFAGSNVNYTNIGVNASNSNLSTGRADVTNIVQAKIGGAGGLFNFSVTEALNNSNGINIQNGEALVVIFKLPTGATTTIGILDGATSSSGDTATMTFANPLDPTAIGFVAEMRIGDGHSFDGTDPNNPTNSNQVSQITANGGILTKVAGHCDDAKDASCDNGNLITVGGDNDPFTPLNPTVGQDHERYNLAPFITQGDTTITVKTGNNSGDDIIFLETFKVTGNGVISDGVVPEPSSLALVGSTVAAMVFVRRRRLGRRPMGL